MNVQPISDKEISDSIKNATNILKNNISDFTDNFWSSNSINNFYFPTDNVEWTTGFCTGQYWLAWELSGDHCFKDAAQIHVESFLKRIENKIDIDHHDMGFLYTPSCVASYKLTGNSDAKKAALLAADNLMARFQEKGEFFQAWGEIGNADNYRLIIDCLLNLPLLYWASEVTQNTIYEQKARQHTQTSLRHLIREDSSTYHTYFFDTDTGEPTNGATHQGYKDNSAWARGQAWGIYGVALSYKYTRDVRCIELFHKITKRFIDSLPSDGVPYWDLDFPLNSNEPKDSSAAAIGACGMLEMCKYMSKTECDKYTELAKQIAGSLSRYYAVISPETSNGLLLHGVYAKSSPYNTVTDRGVDECNTWGDYFWLELLARLSQNWEAYW